MEGVAPFIMRALRTAATGADEARLRTCPVARLEGIDGERRRLELVFQNEYLIARSGAQLLAIVPDLICVLDSETAEPITTEMLRYGQRVKVMGVSVPAIMRTAEALAVFGPAAFGLDEPFRPIETLHP